MNLTPGSAEPRFPGYDVMQQSPHWDETTSAVVLRRLRPAVASVFFTSAEEPVARALLDRLLAQDDEPKVPVFEEIDRRLAAGRGDGFRYEDMPDDPEAWRSSVAALDAEAKGQFRMSFAELPANLQRQIVEQVRVCEGQWHALPAQRVFSLWMRYATTAFYSHPSSWNEIGFGGPAYPRGYKNLGIDRREPWEVAERDAADPVPWAQQAEAAKRRHSDSFQSSDTPDKGAG